MYKIIEINEKNLSNYPQAVCFINPKNEYHGLKINWLKDRFKEGLKIKLLQTDDNKISGFIEYTLGDKAWRAVDAKNYLFVHCLWVYPSKNKNKGFGSALVAEVINDAIAQKMKGVAVITSDNSFMSKKELFVKNGFSLVEEKNGFQLLVKNIKDKVTIPRFTNNDDLKKYQGWHIIYSKQCPWVARFVEEVKPIILKEKIKINFVEIKTAKEAQNTPSIYSVFNLIKDGQILADRYISTTRFLNIIKKNS